MRYSMPFSFSQPSGLFLIKLELQQTTDSPKTKARREILHWQNVWHAQAAHSESATTRHACRNGLEWKVEVSHPRADTQRNRSLISVLGAWAGVWGAGFLLGRPLEAKNPSTGRNQRLTNPAPHTLSLDGPRHSVRGSALCLGRQEGG